MRVWVNGAPSELPEAATVAELLRRLAIDPQQVAVERNQDVIPRRTYADVVLRDGDTVEVVTFVGGG